MKNISRLVPSFIALVAVIGIAAGYEYRWKPLPPRLEANEVEVTIPEGWTVKQIANRLEEAGVVDAEEFIHKTQNPKSKIQIKSQIPNPNLEGFLFPDTYRFFINTPAEKVIERMIARFEEQALPIIQPSERPLYDVLRVASIIEAEVPHAEDRPLVAGILWKRFDAGMGLNVDSTLNYVTGNKSRALSAVELKINSPYNTYKYRGLPPTPINNPGLEVIRAAVFPQDSSYWYYLSDREGVTHYTQTLDEQVKNKHIYLKR